MLKQLNFIRITQNIPQSEYSDTVSPNLHLCFKVVTSVLCFICNLVYFFMNLRTTSLSEPFRSKRRSQPGLRTTSLPHVEFNCSESLFESSKQKRRTTTPIQTNAQIISNSIQTLTSGSTVHSIVSYLAGHSDDCRSHHAE